MHVLNVNSSLDSKTGGGTAERTFQMSHYLAKEGVDCTILTIDTGLDVARVSALRPAKVVAIPLLWSRYYVPRLRWKTITALVATADVIHLMGHWSLLNALVYIAIRRAGKVYAVCPAGALPLFGRSGWLKRFYNFIIGYAIIRNASAWIAVTAAELPQFENYGVRSTDVTVISNAVSEDNFLPLDIGLFRRLNDLPDQPMILFMGRLNSIKGPDLLLQAFILVKGQLPHYQLVFAGPDEGMQSELTQIARLGGVSDRVRFVGFVNGAQKPSAYRSARLLVVPSRQEAMSIVALEAGICGTAVLLTDQCGFGQVRLVDPRLEVPATADGIATGLLHLLRDPNTLSAIAPAWRQFVALNYTWHVVVRNYLVLYGDMLGGAQRL